MHSNNEEDVGQMMEVMGQHARQAATRMASASAAQKNAALHALADVLGEQSEFLQTANAQDVAQAQAAGLSAPMVDRLRLTPEVINTLQEGCLQLAAMADVIGTISGLQEQPSGIRVGQMRVPIGVFGMIFESRPNVTIEAASLSIKSGNACILLGGSDAIESIKALAAIVYLELDAAGL